MSTIYMPARPGDGIAGTEEVLSILEHVMSTYHGDLAGNDTSIGILWAVATGGKPALSLHGYPCAAVVSINNLKARAQGLPDATIAISEAWWKQATPSQREALIDHELYHLELVCDDDGVKLDDLGRPRLAMRRHDFEIGGFDRIMERHGHDAVEAMALKTELEKPRQRSLFDTKPAPITRDAVNGAVAHMAGVLAASQP
jgi:hypothetical protein